MSHTTSTSTRPQSSNGHGHHETPEESFQGALARKIEANTLAISRLERKIDEGFALTSKEIKSLTRGVEAILTHLQGQAPQEKAA